MGCYFTLAKSWKKRVNYGMILQKKRRDDLMNKKNLLLYILILIISLTTIAHANSGPTYWRGSPSLDILAIDENSPIEVKSEELVFDFSKDEYINRGSYNITGLVTATYKMSNPTDNNENVKMAFPFVSTNSNFNLEEIKIKADGSDIPFEVYIGDILDKGGRQTDDAQEDKIDFDTIVSSISNKVYSPKYFDLDEVGILYTYEVKAIGEDNIKVAIEYNKYDYEKTKVISKGFNGYQENNNEVKITSWISDNGTLEVFLLGEEIDLNISGFTNGELDQETDRYSYELIKKELSIRDYMINQVEIYEDYVQYKNYLAENQQFNFYAKTLDEMIGNNVVNLWMDELFLSDSRDRIFVLLYDVEFLPHSLKDISVNYFATSTMDTRKTKEPLHSFEYLLNPAGNWADFNDLNIEIIPPQEHPYIIDSSVKLVRYEDGIYTGNFESLPKEDLSFTLYSKEEITFMDKVERKIYGFRFALPFITSITAGFLINFIINLILKRRKEKL